MLYTPVDKKNTPTAHWHCPPALFWLCSYVASHHLDVAPQSGAKDKFYCTVYSITLNRNHAAQRVSEK